MPISAVPAIRREAVPGRRGFGPVFDQVGSLDGFGFTLEQPDQTDYLLAYDWPYAGRIAQLRITASEGAGIVSVLINNQVVTGLDHVPVAANARSQHNATALNQFVAGDDLTLRVESGADTLLNVRGTVVISNPRVFERQLDLQANLVIDEIPLVGDLAGTDLIPISFDPILLRNPLFIFKAEVIPNSPDEDNIFDIRHEPFLPNDFTGGWNYRLSANSVSGQILRYAFIK